MIDYVISSICGQVQVPQRGVEGPWNKQWISTPTNVWSVWTKLSIYYKVRYGVGVTSKNQRENGYDNSLLYVVKVTRAICSERPAKQLNVLALDTCYIHRKKRSLNF